MAFAFSHAAAALALLASEALVVGVPSLLLVLAALFARGIRFPTTGHRRAGGQPGASPRAVEGLAQESQTDGQMGSPVKGDLP